MSPVIDLPSRSWFDCVGSCWTIAKMTSREGMTKGDVNKLAKFFGRVTDLCTMQQGDDAVALRVERRTSDREVVGLTPARALLPQQP